MLFVLLVWIVGSGPIGCERTTKDTDIRFISLPEAKALFDKTQRGEASAALFVDPRPAKAFAAGHIPGARNLILPQVKPKSKTDPRIIQYGMLVVYGDNPASPTGRGMTKRLIEVGYTSVRFFAGGLEDWNSRNYPLDKSPAPPEDKAAAPETKPDAKTEPAAPEFK
jgi:rhodanese-related sulfurtransferase